MVTKYYSVRLQNLASISDKAYIATAFDGSEAIIPKSQVIGPDCDVEKSDAWWISAWILEKKNLQYSGKKSAWFDTVTRKRMPDYTVEHNTPAKRQPKDNNIIDQLKK
jgi:hypothetical protein